MVVQISLVLCKEPISWLQFNLNKLIKYKTVIIPDLKKTNIRPRNNHSHDYQLFN